MSNEKIYTATPHDFDDEPLGALQGLQAALDAIYERWGGKRQKLQTVRPSLSLGAGLAFLGTDAGRVVLARDDEATAAARAQAFELEALDRAARRKRADAERAHKQLAHESARDELPDGRVKTFYARATLLRVVSHKHNDLHAEKTLEGEGLMGLLFNAALFVQDELGDVPECLSQGSCKVREKSLRAQIGRARTEGRETTAAYWPRMQADEGVPTFAVSTRPQEDYVLCLQIFANGAPEEAEPKAEPSAADLPDPGKYRR